MRLRNVTAVTAALFGLSAIQCSGSGTSGDAGGAGSTGEERGSGGASAVGGAKASGGASAVGSSGAGEGGASTVGTTTVGGATPYGPAAGNPDGNCSSGIPTDGQPADTSNPTTTVGTGTASSCTFGLLDAAVKKGGVITFNCGDFPAVITITATLILPTDKTTVIDGGNKVTLDGGKAVQILRFDDPDWMNNSNGLTLQHIRIANGKTTPLVTIPVAPAPCSQGFNDGEGGALYVRNGTIRVIDCTFEGNQAAQLGPDTGGGAIYVLGSKPAFIVSSTFKDNDGSNAGALGALFTELNVYNCLFSGNTATGNGANSDDATQCSAINNGQHEVGSGGNGGALYSDGVGVSVNICGTQITGNDAGAFGAAIFFTSNDSSNLGSLIIRDSKMTGNVQVNDYWQLGGPGISTNANVVAPVNSVITK